MDSNQPQEAPGFSHGEYHHIHPDMPTEPVIDCEE